MLYETIKKDVKNSWVAPVHPKSVNLYRFIRLMLGPDVNDAEIGRRWKMDGKNFSQFKNGLTPVPGLPRLEQLAKMLKINKHLVFEVAGGTPAKKVFNLIRENNLPGQALFFLC